MKTLISISNPDLRKMFFSADAISQLKQFSEVDWIEEGKPFRSPDLAEIIDQYDACITSWGSPKFTQEVLAQAKRLKFIGHAAGSVVAVVNEDIFNTGITVTNANKPLAKSTAEAAVAFIMAGAWGLQRYSGKLKEGRWSNNNREVVLGVQHRTVGLVGYGEISRHVTKLLRAFDVKILMYSRYCSREEAEGLGVELCELDELLKQSDIVSLHSTWTPETEGMIGYRELALLRDGALFINTARGAIVDEEALIKELRSGRIEAVLDVYKQEPMEKNHPLLGLSNVLCLPHIGGFHGGLKTSFGEYVIQDLHRFIKGEPLQGQITRDIYKRLTPR